MNIENFEELKSKLARSLKNTLTQEAVPPAGEKPVNFELHVPYHQIKLDPDEADTASAIVTYIVRCPSEKKHTVYIKFKYDKSGKFLRETMEYV
jgi:hypothetical protein